MSAEPFSLDELIPEPLSVTLGGREYDVKTVELLGPIELAAFRRMQRRLAIAQQALEKPDPSDADGRAVETLINDLLAVLIPALPPEQLVAVSFKRKSALIEWWASKQPKAEPGKPAAAEPTPARRSRGSSTPATTRSRS